MEICKLVELFEETFGPGDGIRAFTAPGRVNLIGEHIDYCGGKVLPAALTLSNTVLCRANGSREVRMHATDLKGIYTFSLDDIDAAQNLRWGTYQAGVAKELTQAGFRLTGMDMLWDSTLPFGSGLSSSASIELAAGIAFASMAENGLKAFNSEDKIALAVAGQRAENQFCGVNCGIMDQFASAMGLAEHAVLLDCATLKYEYVPLELGKYSLVLANTKKKHALGASKYNERRAEVARGLELMHEALPDKQLPELCGYTPEDFEAARAFMAAEPVISSRVEHVIYENARVYRAKDALASGRLAEFGTILREANDSIRHLYEVTGDELDAMFDEAQDLDYCIGSRMTGAGFGGCTVNIVETARTGDFCAELGKRYTARTGLTPEFYVCSIGDGVREIEL